MNLFPVTTAGAAAARVLGTGGEGEVIAVFNRSFYAAFESGLICVGPPAFGPGPLHLLARTNGIASWQTRIAVGQQAVAQAGRLFVDDLCFDARGVVPWQAPRPRPTSPESLAAGLARLSDTVGHMRPAGLGRLISSVCRDRSPASVCAEDPVARKAWPIIEGLMAWTGRTETSDDGSAPQVKGLLGLGPGLTPSGDDFLAGFLVALQRLGAREPGGKLAAAILPIAVRETNAISAAYLPWAARGEVAASLIDALDAIAAGGGNVEGHLRRISEIGHSSGWDSLAGMVCALKAVAVKTAAQR